MLVVKECLVCGNTNPDAIMETESGYVCTHCDNSTIDITVVDNDEEII